MLDQQRQPVNVVIADDDADLRKALSALLTTLGHQVIGAAADGVELLRLCANGQPVDVVITDLDMPEIDGLEAAEVLAARGIPVILLSGHPDAECIRLEHEPLMARLKKPASRESLQAAIGRVVRASASD